MKIERYYYTEYKKEAEPRIRELQEHLRQQQEALQQLSKEEQKELLEAQNEVNNELLSEIIPLPYGVCTIINPVKYKDFLELAEQSIAFAEELKANLLVYTENTTGYITFVGEAFSHIGKCKDMLQKLTSAADEVYVALSVDMGGGSPTDINGLVRMEFWFDFYAASTV